MKRTLSVFAGAVIAASLVIAPLAASAEEAPVEEPTTVEVVETPITEEPAEGPAPEEVAPTEEAAPVEPQGQPDFICDEDTDGWLTKVDNDAEGNTVHVTAPEGFLIDKYCVKAGTTKHLIAVDPASASVDIDHPEKDSVSHYQIHVIPAPTEPEDPKFVPCTATGSRHFTSLDEWNLTETRSAGHNVLVENGLHVYTDTDVTGSPDPRKAAGYLPVDFALKDYGTFDLDWTGTSPAPGGQMLVDLDNDGTPTGYLVIEDAYNGDWWLSANWANDVDPATLPVSAVGGGGADWASPQEWLNAFPDARIMAIGYSLGSGVNGDGIINSITVGCVTYTFDYEEVVIPEPTVTTLGAPIISDVCGTEDDRGYLPEDTEGVDYEWASDDEEVLDIVAYINEGFVVNDVPEGWTETEGGYLYEWTYEFTDEACPSTTPPATPPTTPMKPVSASLAETGGGDVSPLVSLAGVLTAALGAVLFTIATVNRRRRNA